MSSTPSNAIDVTVTSSTIPPGANLTSTIISSPTITTKLSNEATTEKLAKGKKSSDYDKELVIIFGAAVGLGLIVTIIFCILKGRKQKHQERFITGGGDIEINTSKF